MSKYLRGNEEENQSKSQSKESAFARRVLAKLGGSSVYIEKTKKFIDTEKIE